MLVLLREKMACEMKMCRLPDNMVNMALDSQGAAVFLLALCYKRKMKLVAMQVILLYFKST